MVDARTTDFHARDITTQPICVVGTAKDSAVQVYTSAVTNKPYKENDKIEKHDFYWTGNWEWLLVLCTSPLKY